MLLERRRNQPDSPWTYGALDRRQRELADAIRREGAPGALLLSEVAPVVTLGRRTPPTDLARSAAEYARLGIELVPVDRGGLGTYHGPGQWVVFCVDRLERLTGDPRGVRKAVQGLLELAAEVGRTYGHEVEIRSGAETGVWIPRGPFAGKFAAVGVHIEKGVLLHGLAINGYRTPLSFVGLRPCGLDAQPAFLLRQEEEFEDLGDRIERAARQRFWHQS